VADAPPLFSGGFFTTDFTDFTDKKRRASHPCNPWLNFFGCGWPRWAFCAFSRLFRPWPLTGKICLPRSHNNISKNRRQPVRRSLGGGGPVRPSVRHSFNEGGRALHRPTFTITRENQKTYGRFFGMIFSGGVESVEYPQRQPFAGHKIPKNRKNTKKNVFFLERPPRFSAKRPPKEPIFCCQYFF
jgi:hypothetical protein